MPRGDTIRPTELDHRLLNLDIDEGIRVEQTPKASKKSSRSELKAKDKMYINRKASGTFVIDHNGKFYYTEDRKEVKRIIARFFAPQAKIWVY